MPLPRHAPIDLGDPAVADFFDELPFWSAPFAQTLLAQLPLVAGQTVVDIGCGTGFLALEVAQRLGRASTVIAVDPWPQACARLRRKLDHLGLDHVKVLEEDTAVVALPQASVDLVVSNLGLSNFADPERVLANAYRALRPGGRVMLSSNLVGTFARFYEVFAAVLRAQGRSEALVRLDRHVARRATGASVVALLEARGFVSVAHVLGDFELGFADGESLFEHHFIRLGFLPDWQAVAGLAEWPAVREALVTALAHVAEREGGVRLAVPYAVWSAERPA